MKSRLLSDQQDNFGGVGSFDDLNTNLAPFGPAVSNSANTGTSSTPPRFDSTPLVPAPPDESVQAMAAVSGSSSAGPGSVVAESSSSGFTINLVFDAAAMAAPVSFRAGVEQAAAILSSTISNKITVNINIDYSGTGGGAAAGPDNGLFENYSTVRSDLMANAAPGDTSFNALPTGSKIQGQSQVAVWNAQLKLFGLMTPNSTSTDDGSATFATDINPNLLVGVALHELTHAIGRVPYGQPDGPQPDIFDFYRFTSPGNYLFTDNIPASSAYFSLDGGFTKLADFGVSSDPSDFLNSGLQGGNDPFNEFYSGSTLQTLTSVDKEMLDALGFNTAPQGLVVVSNAADALQGGGAVALLSGAPNINDPGSTTLSSATIKIANAGGLAVAGDKLFVNGIQNGSLGNGVTASWNATTNTLTLTGAASIAVYDTLLTEVTFQDTGTDTSSGSHPIRTVTWTINDGTNTYNATSQITIDRAPVATNNAATDTVGATVTATAASGVLSNDTDLDGDKLTVTAVSDTAHGAGVLGFSLAGVYGHLTLNADSSYSYVADNVAAISGGPTGSHLQDAFSYTVSDGNGGAATASLTVTLDRAPVVTAGNVTLAAGHTTIPASSLFSAMDPDGNAITTYGFEDTGSGHFVLNGAIQPNNQEIDVTAAQLSQLTYQSLPGSAADTVEVRVNDGTLWSNWTSFTVTGPSVIIQTDGTTALTEVSNNYFLNPTGGGTGPELHYGGSLVTAGEFGTWTPIGAIQVAGGGYDIAWHDPSSGLYTVWSTDSNGNYLSNIIGAVPGSNTTLENLESTFQQDLNGDGTIGLPKVVVQTDGSTALTEVGNNYFLNPAGGGTGPELHYSGSVVTAGEFGTWAPIGAVQVASGYDIAWHDPSSGLYTVWSTDSNGNYLSNVFGAVPGNNSALESLETTFNQDLNGDGTIGLPPPPPPVIIQTDGTTALTKVGSDYFLNPTGGGTGPELQRGGAPVTVGEYGTWTPIGAVQVASGYDVAWHDPSSGLYTVWSTDGNGNYLSNVIGAVPGNNSALESLETTFNQDLNGDSTIGIPKNVIQTDGTTALTAVGNNYFLNPTGGGTGPELHYSGSVVTAGEFGTWTPIGAVQVAGGYDIAWHDPNSGLYTVWSTDSNGNYVSNLIGAVPGNNSALESIETTFNQDLNGDGTIGIPPATQPATASAQSLTNSVPENFQFAGGSGPVQDGVVGAPAPNNAATIAGHDVFVFAPNFGQVSIANFAPATDRIDFSKAVLANLQSVLAATHDDTSGNAVITDAAHDTITLKQVATAELLAHQSDFHFI
jgi:VCBS repeat-containing protein